MILSPIEPDDFKIWQDMRKALYQSCDEDFLEDELIKINQRSDWFCYLIKDVYGEMIGMVELSSRNVVDGCLSSPVAYLEGLYLLPEYRAKGIGRQVIQLVLQWSKSNGFSELATDTELTNTKAQKFYSMLGFEEVDRVVEYRIQVK
ncbi:GNAT family N-acetyltransferase [Aliikangiella coralliicola]|uniref:GNAT family N-acetyltransferase n=1 Tax=Aliikangiella coralliicola TaxID=2592383 RepID=A0A545UHU7_9GAMM|nr:GNAT family N-acetyltransferase [Aliikangiella coralliicola]TQV89047.1 GNAT family N-acetyltransferase [Aliikangiella coralliicola]